ncbi:late embryogenesis abundant protein Lea5-D-like [Durio zibethinus]|uniref:Late embryogenesis abundant protein Lea5-D-like n=1 Tax=Durio zibethinus TaxID=66656 RepID=A0A6P6A6M9_DURZI|nr:late embryogenesis abundant protein Lea5-D-like [Durio zibethinus]
MARFLSSFKLFATSVSDGLSLSVFRRGYSAAAPHGALTASRPGMVGKIEQRGAVDVMKEESGPGVSSAWAPDPVTGYYRPENCAAEIDAAELREMLLNHKVRPH